MGILFLLFSLCNFCLGMENSDASIASAKSDSSSTSVGSSWASFENLPPRPSMEGNAVTLETLPFRQLTIGGDGDSLRSSAVGNTIVEGNEEEVFFLEHTQEAKKGTLSPDKLYIACYGESDKGSWIDIFFRKEKNEMQQIHNYPIPLGEFVDMRWKGAQLNIANRKHVSVLTVQHTDLQPSIIEKSLSISQSKNTRKEIKGLVIINACCFILLKKTKKSAAYFYEIDTDEMKKRVEYKLKGSEKENDFFLHSPKEIVDTYSIASRNYLWRFSLNEMKDKSIPSWLPFSHEICAFITVTRKPVEVICCAHTDKTFSFWDITKGTQINIPGFCIKNFDIVTKMSMYNQSLYISDAKQTIDYPIVQLLRASNSRMSYI